MSSARHPHHNIVLTGFHAAGKTSVGRELSRRTRRPFTDSSELRRRRTGLRVLLPIGGGWDSGDDRRAIEDFAYRREQLLELSVDAVSQDGVYEDLRDFSFIVFIDPPFEELWRRLQEQRYDTLREQGKDELWSRWQALRPRLELCDLQLSGSFSVKRTVQYILHSFYS